MQACFSPRGSGGPSLRRAVEPSVRIRGGPMRSPALGLPASISFTPRDEPVILNHVSCEHLSKPVSGAPSALWKPAELYILHLRGDEPFSLVTACFHPVISPSCVVLPCVDVPQLHVIHLCVLTALNNAHKNILSISDSDSVYCQKMGSMGVRVLADPDTSRPITLQ